MDEILAGLAAVIQLYVSPFLKISFPYILCRTLWNCQKLNLQNKKNEIVEILTIKTMWMESI